MALTSRKLADGSVRMKALGGPYHNNYYRWYPPFDDEEPLLLDNGRTVEVYCPREGEPLKWTTWNWIHDQKESDLATRRKYGRELPSE